MVFKGPGNLERTEEDMMEYSMPIKEWFILHRFRDLSDLKSAHMGRFNNALLRKFDPYFHKLHPCISALLDLLFPPIPASNREEPLRNLMSCQGKHDDILNVLQSTYDSLPFKEEAVEQKPSNSKRPSSSKKGLPSSKKAAPSSKRKKPKYDLPVRITRRRTDGGSISHASGSGMALDGKARISKSKALDHTSSISCRSISAMGALHLDTDEHEHVHDSGVYMITPSHGMVRRSTSMHLGTRCG